MNSVRFVQQFRPTALEYLESDRLDAKVARSFHKHIQLETHASWDISASAVSAASATTNAANSTPASGTTSTAASTAASAVTSAANSTTFSATSATSATSASASASASYPLAVDSKKIMVEGKMMMVYWRKALDIPFGRIQGGKMRLAVEEAILELAKEFPPPKPKAPDAHHQLFEEALQKHGPENCGVYHFEVSVEQQGIKDPVLSYDLISTGEHHNSAYMFYRSIAPLIQAVSLLFQAVDPEMHLHYLKQYRAACEVTPMDSWTTSRRACFQGIVLTRNLPSEPLQNKSDYKDGWVVLCCWGEFTGANLVVPALKQSFEFQPGDVIIFRACLLEHYVTPFLGQRSSIMFFSQNDVMGNLNL